MIVGITVYHLMSSFRKTIVLLLLLSLIHLEQIQVLGLQLPKPFNEHGKLSSQQQPSPLQVASMYAVAPVIPAVALPMLAENFRATQDPTALLFVLIAKRTFIYILAILATSYAGWRASTSTALPAGQSLDALNRELLRGETAVSMKEEKDKKERRDDEIFATLDERDDVGKNMAVALPFFLSTALAISYVLVTGDQTTVGVNNNIDTFDAKEIFNTFSLFSNFAICLLFAAAEYRSSSHPIVEDNRDTIGRAFKLPNLIAFGTVMAAFLLPLSFAWPFQNSINIAIAVTVTRALAPFINGEGKSIQNIALALVGLSVYDTFSVFGTNLISVQSAVAAVDTLDMASVIDTVSFSTVGGIIDDSTSLITAADSSVMETVARSKLQGPWRPGLLEMVLVGKVSDALGLGDIVFPACLVSWGFAFDISYAFAAIAGYVLGSFFTEVASTLGPEELVSQGLPALLFITPAMLSCVTLLGQQRGDLGLIWGEDTKPNPE
jgi:hypothetical protein